MAALFHSDCSRIRDYYKTQASLVPVLIVNKIDVIADIEFATIKESLKAINPDATIVQATYGVVKIQGPNEMALTGLCSDGQAEEAIDRDQGAAHSHDHHHNDLEVTFGLKAWEYGFDRLI